MFDRNLMKLDGMRAIMMALVASALVQAVAIIGQAIMLGEALGELWSGSSLQATAPRIAAFLACFAVLHILRFAQETMLDRYSKQQAASLRDRILSATFNSRTMLARKQSAATVATTASEGIDEVQTYIRIIPPKTVGIVSISVPLLVAAWTVDWVSGVILTVMFPVIIFFMVVLGRQASARAERQYAAYTRLSRRFMDTLRGMAVVKAFGASKAEGASVHAYSERLRRATVRTLTTATLSSAVLDLCATFGVAAVAMMLAFRLMDGSLQLGTALAALMIAPEYFSPIRAFASDFHASLDGKNALAAVLDMIPGMPADTEQLGASEPQPHWSPDSELEFEGVTFGYDGGSAVGPFTFSAHGCQRIAVIGASGSGKSTLANLLAGFYEPDGGSITIDGRPADLSDESWKGAVRYVPQHPYLFHASLRDNICFYAPQASEAEVERVVDSVGLARLVDELPDGLDTVIGQGGRGVSGGQAHRIALARILLDRNARVLVFDEPTAHLDIETELDLKPPMLDAMEGKLVFFATHRLHWAADVDVVIELDGGTIASIEPGGRGSGAEGDHTAYRAPVTMPNDVLASADCPQDACDPAPSSERRRTVPSWLKELTARYRRSIVVALALGLAALGSAALLMFTSGYLISATAQPDITLFSIMVPIALVQVFGIGRPFARYLERLVSHDWVLKITSDIRLFLYRGVNERMGDPARERAAGEYLGILSDDVAHLQNLYLRVAFPTALAYLLALGTLVLLGAFSIPFALVMLVLFLLVTLILPIAAFRCTHARSHELDLRRHANFAQLTDDILGSVDWVLANRGAHATALHARADDDARECEARIRLAERTVRLVSALLLGIGCCAVVGWCSVRFAGGAPLANWIAAFALGFFPLIETFSALPDAFVQVSKHADAIDRLDEYIDGETVETARIGRTRDEAALDSPIAAEHPTALSFSQVTYAYPSTRTYALHEFSLDIPIGQSVALLGRSGSGKSTFARMARGEIAPQSGSACVLGTESDLSPAPAIGYLGQDPYLFNRTLRENLALGVSDAVDAELQHALEVVGLGGKVSTLEDGLDTVVGETGVGFSGGEEHRIALARVIVADPAIVLVDEPFSMLDPATEQALVRSLFETCAGKTLIVITHHLAEIERFDRVVFIENGTVALDGSPDELMKRSDYFRALVSFDGTRQVDANARLNRA